MANQKSEHALQLVAIKDRPSTFVDTSNFFEERMLAEVERTWELPDLSPFDTMIAPQ